VSYLADACALIAFYASTSPVLSPEGVAIMEASGVQVSPVTAWEITRKVSLGKLPPLPTGGASLSGFLRGEGFGEAPFGWAEAENAARLPPHHADPMDRFLIATALRHDLTIVTCDSIFAEYGVKTAW
jgi:PIN domain nuclease of toxin-antitoxin system